MCVGRAACGGALASVGAGWSTPGMRPLAEFSRTSDVLDAINALVVEGGLRGPSQRQIAAVVRISPGTLMHEYGNRSEMLRRACVQAARDHVRAWNQRWSERWYLAAPERRGPALLLPDHEQELSHERQWGAWRELARSDVAMLPGLGVALEGERRAVEWAREQLGRERDELATDALLALVTGVITRMVDPEEPWTLEHASRVLESAWC